MTSLSAGFCQSAVFSSFSRAELTEWKRQWNSPCLQVVDIQRNRMDASATASTVKRCFYLAGSDSLSLVWLVVPPKTELEERILHYQLDIGCCVFLKDYTLVSAFNGLNVVVPLSVCFSPHYYSLIGTPEVDWTLFQLSEKALQLGSKTVVEAERMSTEITLDELVKDPQCVLQSWSLTGRIVWKSPSRRMQDTSVYRRREGVVLPVVVVDCNGDAIDCILSSSSSHETNYEVGNCVRLQGGSVTWSETGVPLKMQFFSKESSHTTLIENSPAIPTVVRRLPFEQSLLSAREVIEMSSVEDHVSLIGVISTTTPGRFINTKRGRVLKSSILVVDKNFPAFTVEVTCWGELAEAVSPEVGETWVFRSVVVKEFLQKKTLSSRYDTSILKLADAEPSLPPKVIENKTTAEERTAQHEMETTLCLLECSETLPCVSRVQEVDFSPTLFHCAVCATGIENPQHHCPQCNGEELSGTLACRVIFSDGVDCEMAVLSSSVAESLLDISSTDFFANAKRDATYQNEFSLRLVGTPVLLWLLRTPDAPAAVVSCKHLNLTYCSFYLLRAIHSLLEPDEP